LALVASAFADEPKGSVIKIATNKGDITVETFDKDAPITAGNFDLLVKAGFYDGITFHRVVPGFVIQGGDPTGTGGGGPGWAIPLEVKPELKHARGILSMARTQDPNSAGSQFFVCLDTDAVQCLNMQYAVFGKVLTGLDVVDKIVVGDKMLKVTLEQAGPDEAAAEKATLAARIKPGAAG
jgi:peptidyl-prolyl cis-trans isomerase B (cyclophilin B)